MFKTLASSSSSSSSSGVAVVGAVIMKLGVWVAFATPTERLRRDGLGKQ